jgi:hypothetical protein
MKKMKQFMRKEYWGQGAILDKAAREGQTCRNVST